MERHCSYTKGGNPGGDSFLRKLTFRFLALNLVVASILGGLSVSTLGYRIETVALDQWFAWRYRLFGSASIDARLMLVAVDEKTVDLFGKPQLLWQSDLAKLIELIKSGRPAVVGVDMVISPSTHGLSAQDPLQLRLQDEALELATACLEGPPVVLSEVYSTGSIFHNQSDKNEVVGPHEVILDALQDENGDVDRLGVANLTGDTDGVQRRYKLFRRLEKKSGQEAPSNLVLKLLQQATGQAPSYSPDGPQLSWEEARVPFLFDQSFLLNYPGPVENEVGLSPSLTYPAISAAALLKGEVSPQVLEGKIVLIAPTAPSLQDLKVVPGDSEYPGGAVHLTALNMFLQNQFILRSPLLWIVLALGWSGAGMVLGRRGRPGAAAVALAGVSVLSFVAFSFANLWLPSVFPTVALVAGTLLGYTERLLTIERDRALVRSTFARMVSPQVMHHVLANYRSLKTGQRKELTVLFSDINDFTPICEKHDPEEVIEMLSEYFSKMVDVIMKYNGYLKQYVGDEIMVIYGAPEDSEDHATRAVLTALEMRRVLAEAKQAAQGAPGFYEVKIGINTGSVVVGKVGPESRWEYAAVGDDVNLGARVMSAAKNMGMDIGVSAATKARYDKERSTQSGGLPDPVRWISKGVQSFKGKTSQMEVFGIERIEADPGSTHQGRRDA